MKIKDFLKKIPENRLDKNIFISIGKNKYEIAVLNWNSGDLALEVFIPTLKEIRIQEIRNKYIEARFPGRAESYIEEWEFKFKEGIEWQKSDFQGRHILQKLAPDIYPENVNAFFIRE